MLQEAFSGGLYGTNPVRIEDGFPRARIRRMRWSGHWMQAGSRICESVFFRFKLWIVAFFPGFCPPKFDFVAMQNRPKRLNTDRRNDLFLNKIFTKFFKRPSLEVTAEKVGQALSSFGNESSVIFGKLCRSARTRFWFQRLKTVLVEFFDDSSDMMFGIVNKFGDVMNLITLIGSKHHLPAANFDTTGTAAKDPLNCLAFADTEVSGIQTHKKSLSMRNNIELFLRVCLYNTHLCIAQVLNIQKVNIIFLKRH